MAEEDKKTPASTDRQWHKRDMNQQNRWSLENEAAEPYAKKLESGAPQVKTASPPSPAAETLQSHMNALETAVSAMKEKMSAASDIKRESAEGFSQVSDANHISGEVGVDSIEVLGCSAPGELLEAIKGLSFASLESSNELGDQVRFMRVEIGSIRQQAERLSEDVSATCEELLRWYLLVKELGPIIKTTGDEIRRRLQRLKDTLEEIRRLSPCIEELEKTVEAADKEIVWQCQRITELEEAMKGATVEIIRLSQRNDEHEERLAMVKDKICRWNNRAIELWKGQKDRNRQMKH